MTRNTLSRYGVIVLFVIAARRFGIPRIRPARSIDRSGPHLKYRRYLFSEERYKEDDAITDFLIKKN